MRKLTKNLKIRVYLAGNIDGRGYEEVFTERVHIASQLKDKGFVVFDPFDGRDSIDDKISLEAYNLEIAETVVKDEFALANSDAVIVLTGDTPTSGTWFEFAFAHYCLKIPIVVVAPKLKNSGKSTWTTAKATKIVNNADEAIDWLSDFFEEFIWNE